MSLDNCNRTANSYKTAANISYASWKDPPRAPALSFSASQAPHPQIPRYPPVVPRLRSHVSRLLPRMRDGRSEVPTTSLRPD